MKVRNHSFSKNSVAGKEIDCVDEFCPCRNCYIIGFDEYKNKKVFFCENRMNNKCHPESHKPRHKLSKERRKGYQKCLICGVKIKTSPENARKYKDKE